MTTTAYSRTTRAFHWLTAVLLLAIIPLGLVANDAPFGTDAEIARKILLFSLHKTLGIAIFIVALARIAYASTQTNPAPLHPDRIAETLLANIVHWLLYLSLVLVPLSGCISHAAAAVAARSGFGLQARCHSCQPSRPSLTFLAGCIGSVGQGHDRRSRTAHCRRFQTPHHRQVCHRETHDEWAAPSQTKAISAMVWMWHSVSRHVTSRHVK